MRKTLYIVVAVLLLGVFCFSGYKLWDTLQDYAQSRALYEELAQNVIVEAPAATGEREDDGPAASEVEVSGEASPIYVDFKLLQRINPDVVGWIFCPDTNISYPVVQGEDNEEYLHRAVDGSYQFAGTPFLDAADDPKLENLHSVIYGHNMKDRSMFSQLLSYGEQEFYEAHREMYYLTPEGNYRLHLISGYLTDARSDSYRREFLTREEYEDYLALLCSRSAFRGETLPKEGVLLTLSTCGNGGNEERFVLHGIAEKIQ